MRNPALTALCWLCVLPAPGFAAENTWSLHADDWARPRDGRSVVAMPPLPQVVAAWTRQPEQRLMLRHPGGEEGLLWAHELRAWLVALGIPMQALELVSGTGNADRLELELTR